MAKKDYFEDPTRWETLFWPPAGSNIGHVAGILIQYLEETGKSYVAFLFNDTKVGIYAGDTVDAVCDRYGESRKHLEHRY